MTSETLSPNKGNILIGDDTPENLKLLTALLKSRGYIIRPAPNGRLALSGAKAIPPDLILLDVKMPEIDGYEVCKRLKSAPSTSAIPIIFISALTETVGKLKGFDAAFARLLG